MTYVNIANLGSKNIVPITLNTQQTTVQNSILAMKKAGEPQGTMWKTAQMFREKTQRSFHGTSDLCLLHIASRVRATAKQATLKVHKTVLFFL